ncbi:hypothetical protein MPLSOD_50107 [Mesorhizobium sp. SOD10]|nr:hypothetical protein MPLSOD_50107 [Mesorhizobium sp. SOD10]
MKAAQSGLRAADTALHWGATEGGKSAPKVDLIQPLILPFLVLDVFSDHRFASTDGPKVLHLEIPTPLSIT